MSSSRRLLVAVAWASLALLGGCKMSVHLGKNEVSKADVETEVAKDLAAKVSQPEPKVTCPSGLRAKVGASLDCDLRAQGDTDVYVVHVVVASVKDGKVHFNATVADTPKSSGSTTTP
jgi:hypothetical protein